MIVPTVSEFLRQVSVESCFELDAFRNGWPIWKTEINDLIGPSFNENHLFDIGDNLSSIFSTTGGGGRSQGSLSGGGYGWEGLVCWYLNLCFAGSRGVALRKFSHLPEPIRDSISVNYGSFKSNTESDIVVLIFPDQPEFNQDRNSLNILDARGSQIPVVKRGKFNSKELLNRLTELYFDSFELGVIQCKTNWNDNAQIPMLWSMIYETERFANNAISIGRNGYSMRDIRQNFTYSFMTVPTNDLSNYKQTSTAVNRVRNLSGGNYWGYPTRNSVARSIKEIFNNNFRRAFHPNARKSLKNVLPDLSGDLRYFDLM